MSIEFSKVFHINGKEIHVTVDFTSSKKEIYRFPELYKIDKLGRTSMWRIYVIGDQYFRESGIKNGKVKSYAPVRAIPKNVGRANETTPEEQALFEAFSEWKHKKDQVYAEGESETENTGAVEDAVIGERLRPMLAEKWSERKHYAKFPGAVSPKLDGVRVMIYKNDQNEIIMISRNGKIYNHMNGIREEARKVIDQFNVVLDGELYSHNIPFNAISGAVRSQNKPSKYDSILEYYVFDIWKPSNPELTYENRMKLLRNVCEIENFKRLRFLFYETVENEEKISDRHTEYVLQGYEGLIFRNLDSVYKLGRRVNDLLKYKEFEDDEFEVVNVVEGVGSEAGAAIFICKTKDGKETFNVRPRGSIEKRRKQYENRKKYIGKKLTVRYQPLTKEEIRPRFPVGIKFEGATEEIVAIGFRDYE